MCLNELYKLFLKNNLKNYKCVLKTVHMNIGTSG